MGVLGLETGTPRGLCGQADSRDGRLAAVGHLENQRRPGCGRPGAHGALLQSPVCRQPWSGLLVFFCEMCLILALSNVKMKKQQEKKTVIVHSV